MNSHRGSTASCPVWVTARRSGCYAPVEVSDVADPKLMHLAGLSLSRAWALAGISRGLPVQDLRVKRLEEAAATHADFEAIADHWLAQFTN